jgi:hypothetical protein
MKHCLLTFAALLVAASSSFAQGTVVFANSPNAVVTLGGTPVTGTQGWVTALWGGPNAASLVPTTQGGGLAADPTAFRDDRPGFIRSATREVPGVAAGSAAASLQMIAWNTSLYGSAGPAQSAWSSSLAGFGMSEVVAPDGALGGGIALPASMSLLKPFAVNAVPEPTVAALGLLGAGLLLIRRKK